MQPGEAFKVTVEWDFTVPSKVNDWSVVAYGALGPVTVTHPTWSTSDSFPFTPRAFKSTNNTTFVNTTWRAEAKADFLNWANSVGPAPPTGSGGCSSVWWGGENAVDGNKTLFKNNCYWFEATYTVWMIATEWSKIQYFYEGGGYKTVLTNCGKTRID